MKVKLKEIFEAFELTKDTDHPLIRHYGDQGEITSEEQIKTRALVEGGASYQPYGKIIVIQDYMGKRYTKAFFKSEFDDKYEII